MQTKSPPDETDKVYIYTKKFFPLPIVPTFAAARNWFEYIQDPVKQMGKQGER